MTDNLELELESPAVEEAAQPAPVSVNDVLEKKIDYFTLPKDERDRLLQDYQKTLPEDSLTKKLGINYAPPEMFGGKDRQGNPVRPKSLEEFEQDIINKIKYSKNDNGDAAKTKEELIAVKKQMEEMSALVKMQANSHLQGEEERLAQQIQQAKDDYNFDLYDELISKKNDLQQRKSQFTPPEQKQEKVEPQVRPQYTQQEADAIQDFKYAHKDFVQTVSGNSQILTSFDDFTKSIARNRPDLHPKEILDLAKESTERMFSNFFTKQNNVFMNNQYAGNNSNNNTFQKKAEAPKLSFERLSPSDQKFIEGTARDYPGKSYQQVTEIVFGKYQPKA